jgi:hypothetical protein
MIFNLIASFAVVCVAMVALYITDYIFADLPLMTRRSLGFWMWSMAISLVALAMIELWS